MDYGSSRRNFEENEENKGRREGMEDAFVRTLVRIGLTKMDCDAIN